MLSINSCIIRVPVKKENDSSDKFSVSDFQTLHPITEFTDLSVEKIDSIINTEKKAVFIVFATWCAPCYANLRSGYYRALQERLKGVKVVFLSINYDLSHWQKFNSEKLPSDIFFFQTTYVGENEKIQNLRNLLCKKCDTVLGVPQYFWFENSELLSTSRDYTF
jgi:thiol-disulfide isomerase/thioredoxin